VAAGRPYASTPPDPPKLRIPKINTDLVWSLKPWPTQIYIGGLELEIPPLTAADWIPSIIDMMEDTLGLLMGVLSEDDQGRLTDLMFTGTVEADDLFTLCTDLLTTVGARPWWVTIRLITVAQQNWDTIGAEMMMKGVNAAAMSLAGWLDVFLLVLLRMMDPKETTMFTMKLEMVPPEFMHQVPEESLEISADAFLSMAG
jgi:hypothetical protein